MRRDTKATAFALRRTIEVRSGFTLILLVAALRTIAQAGQSPPAETVSAPFRIAFSSSMFSDVNEDDARAAVKVWGLMIVRERNVPTDLSPSILRDVDALRRALQQKEADAVGMLTTEYAQVFREIEFGRILINRSVGRMTERYVLLVHQDGPTKTLADLRGRSVLFHANPRSCLAPAWLDTLLLERGHPATERHAGRVSREAKLSKVVLPVFFRQADACVVTRTGFDTMCELNPQLAKRLVVLAESPEVVPTLFAFRGDYHPPFEEQIFSSLEGLSISPAGQQLLTIFQSEEIVELPVSCLDSAMALLAAHARLSAGPDAPENAGPLPRETGEKRDGT